MFLVFMPGNTVPVNVRWKMRKLLKKTCRNAVRKLLKNIISVCFYSTYIYFDRLAT